MNVEKPWVYGAVGTIALLFSSMIYAWSVFSVPIAEEFPLWSQLALSAVFTVAMICFCVSGLVSGWALGRGVSIKKILPLAASLMLTGFWLAASAHSPFRLMVGFGVLLGLGAGFAYNSILSTVTPWFSHKPGLISGILLMGFGLGSSLAGFAFQGMAGAFASWRTAFRVLGLAVFVVLLGAAFLLQAPPLHSDQGERSIPSLTPGEMLKTPTFYFFYGWAVVLSAAGLVLVSQASGMAIQIFPTLSSGERSALVGLISAFNGLGRVIFGGMYDRQGYRRTMGRTMGLFALTAGLLFSALHFHSLPFLVAGFVLGGLSYGGITPTNSAFVRDFYGPQCYAMNFSIVGSNLIFSSLGSSFSGALYDASGSYLSSVAMMGVLTALSVICLVGIKKSSVEGLPSPL